MCGSILLTRTRPKLAEAIPLKTLKKKSLPAVPILICALKDSNSTKQIIHNEGGINSREIPTFEPKPCC